MREINMKDLYLSCSEDRSPLDKISILSFHYNIEKLIRSLRSLLISLNNYVLCCLAQKAIRISKGPFGPLGQLVCFSACCYIKMTYSFL